MATKGKKGSVAAEGLLGEPVKCSDGLGAGMRRTAKAKPPFHHESAPEEGGDCQKDCGSGSHPAMSLKPLTHPGTKILEGFDQLSI
jgi:hypothetical protein